MNWTTGVLGAGTVLLALALGGVRGLLVALALVISCWLMRSISNVQTALQEQRSQEPNEQRRRAERKAEQERQWQERRRQAEPGRGSGERRQRSERRPQRSEETDAWWSVLEVAPDASADEIRHAYRHKIKQCHPDRVMALAPELLELAERSTRTLNAAYSEANRIRRIANAAQ
jgi:DnaJ-domain-containing protein 1